jgi:hypothetical protein
MVLTKGKIERIGKINGRIRGIRGHRGTVKNSDRRGSDSPMRVRGNATNGNGKRRPEQRSMAVSSQASHDQQQLWRLHSNWQIDRNCPATLDSSYTSIEDIDGPNAFCA